MNEQEGSLTFFGKYRALVVENKDPSCRGRIQVKVPAIPGVDQAWAVPCAPYAGPDVGFYAIPPIGALVWVEFEGGNVDQPIWVGSFWGADQVPTEVAQLNSEDPSQVKIWKTRVFKLWIDDTDKKGQVVLEYVDPTIDDPVTVNFTLDKSGLAITVSGSKGTSKITETPQLISTDSEKLTTNSTKDTAMTVGENMTVTVTKDLTVKADGAVSVTAAKDLSAEGQNVNATAKTNMTLKASTAATLEGSSSATVKSAAVEVNGSATTTIKGGMVKIN